MSKKDKETFESLHKMLKEMASLMVSDIVLPEEVVIRIRKKSLSEEMIMSMKYQKEWEK